MLPSPKRRTKTAGGIERSGCPYVRPSVDQVKILSKVESQDLLMVAS